ncbi:MAG: hypothetical protein LBP85_05950 [Prevotellaceae bacterium]|jgi:hypothetical protein|nr:hypothetical protein [Prevotellaceae bacterium]
MKIKSAKSFRSWYKTEIIEIDRNNPDYDENFVGTYYKKNGRKIKGFFEMYHGDKPDIAGYLLSILKIAEDGQAIYEFLQNAVDCNSTHFYIFYNEKYFLAINNGEPFDVKGLRAILNIAQGDKKDADKIGRFGIGFKLAHRLVGKNEGADELINQYKGPILFSWSKSEDLESLMNNEKIETLVPDKENHQEFISSPYLLKLILTNFPAGPNESVKDLNYNNRILFPQEELNELVHFINESFNSQSDSLKKSVLGQGSLFFIKLGEGKKDLLDKDYSELKNGIQYSMNMLKRLQKVYVNNENIDKITLWTEEGTIRKNTEEFNNISPEYKEYDIKFTVGFNAIVFGNEKSYGQMQRLKETPNFYKYFPMGDEVNGFGFIVHCDSFSIETNRRKLHEDEINKNLFPEIAKHLISRLDYYKETDRNRFLNLYACLLLSDIPERQNNRWLRPVFYNSLLVYLKANIPTKAGFCNTAQNVKINRLKLNLILSDFGLGNIQWFEWNSENDEMLITEAKDKDKLSIESWDIRDIVENANIDNINDWIANCDDKTYEAFLDELENSELRIKTKKQICCIKIFRFSDGKYYSFHDIFYINVVSTMCRLNDIIICNEKTYRIKSELEKLGFITSDKYTYSYPNIYSSFKMPADKWIYELIAYKCKTNTLNPADKKKMFINFIDEQTKFEDIGKETLKELNLFSDSNGQIKPLKDLITGELNTPEWLKPYTVNVDEFFIELKPYLIQEDKIYQDTIFPHWNTIVAKVTGVINLYEKTVYYFGLREDNSSLNGGHKFVYTEDGFLTPHSSKIFFNPRMIELGTQYGYFQNAVRSLFGLPTPAKDIIPFLVKDPFRSYLSHDSIFRGHRFIETVLEVNEIKSVISFCKHNNEPFFKYCIIEKNGSTFSIREKPADVFQITSPDKQAIDFIDKNCSDKLTVLPYEFWEYKDEDGIIKADDLYGKILECVNVDEHKEMLVDIVKYKKYKTKLQFIQRLSKFGFNADKTYTKDDYEYKILELICAELKENDYPGFREKVTVETGGRELKLSDIPLYKDKIKIEDIELSLSEILPDSYENTDALSSLLDNFVNLGLPQDRLYSLFGVNTEPEQQTVYAKLSKENLQNAQQLAFLVLCNDGFGFNISDELKISFIEFAYNGDHATLTGSQASIKLLGFDPKQCVYPNEYACESEQLPEYLINWINNEDKIRFLSDLGVWTEGSTIVDLRKFWKEQGVFDSLRLSQELRFNTDKTNLTNSFEYLKSRNIQLSTNEQYDAFRKAVELANVTIEEFYDFELIQREAKEWDDDKYLAWKDKLNNKFSIYRYDGELPKIVKIKDRFENYIFYRYNASDAVFNESNICINKQADIKNTLYKLASGEKSDFTVDDLWQLFNNNTDTDTESKLKTEIEELKAKIEELKKGDVDITTGNGGDIPKEPQIAENREAKQFVKQWLEAEGFQFPDDYLNQYSTINGVTKDGIEYPLVVKSYKWHAAPFKIGANEWIHLMEKNSMFWVYLGQNELGESKLGCLKIFDLLRNQSQIKIAFSTENLDTEERIKHFAEILRYFKDVHFNFDNFYITDTVNDLQDYRFDTRKTEEDITDNNPESML